MLPFFSKKRIPSDQFEACVFKHLVEKVSNKKAIGNELKSIRLLSTLSVSGSREREAARLYRKIEDYVSGEQPRHRVSREDLRDYIFRSCHPERAEGDFAILFLPSSFQKLKLIEEFTDFLFARAKGQLGEKGYAEVFSSIQLRDEYAGLIKKDSFDWSILERGLHDAPEAGEKQAEITLAPVLDHLSKTLAQNIGLLRTEKLYREVYREFRERFGFLEEVVPYVLLVLPGNYLQDERVAIMPKAKLEKEVKERAQKLEYTLGELKEEKQKLANALHELQMIDRAKGDFIAVVSHQFRTPLSVIRWSAELLIEEISKLTLEESEKFRKPVSDIYSKSVFLISILQDVYDVLAIEGGTAIIERSPNQLWEIISDVVKGLRKEAKRNHVLLEFDRTNVPLEEASLDRGKIGRALEILVRNAIQYTPEKGRVTITLGKITLDDKPALECTVRDTGIGIKEEDLPKIFAKFFRTKDAIKTVPDGAGLGLYLVKHFVEAHSGTVTVESELGKGTSFTFVLPQE